MAEWKGNETGVLDDSVELPYYPASTGLLQYSMLCGVMQEAIFN